MDSTKLYIPDAQTQEHALERTTHLAIASHHDDLEIMAINGILQCYQSTTEWFTGIILTDGAGFPRPESREKPDAAQVRANEQRRAADLGEYGALIMLAKPSSEVKDPAADAIIHTLADILERTTPSTVYAHNLTDRHDTHVAAAIKTIQAIRLLDPKIRPKRLLGCEVWRDLDWLTEQDRVALDCSGEETLQRDLIQAFKSQITAGKRYDHAVMGRRKAHATYHQSHAIDSAKGLTFAMDMTPLIENDGLNIGEFALGFAKRLSQDIEARIAKHLR